jgi:hypothetical protein
LVAAAVVFSALGGATATADSVAPPATYTKATLDGKHLLVMVSPLPVENDAIWDCDSGMSVREIRSKYANNGLYRNDGSITPVWTVDWYARSVIVTLDGVHAIRGGPWPSSIDQEALSFFTRGSLTRTYAVRDLVDVPWLLSWSVSHFTWQENARFDATRLEYTVVTQDGNRFTFDVRSGQIVSERRPLRPIVGGIIGAIGVIALGLFAWFLG